jgi:hypothetical protein
LIIKSIRKHQFLFSLTCGFEIRHNACIWDTQNGNE